MQALLNDIITYCQYLHGERGLALSIHFGTKAVYTAPQVVFSALLPYHAHNNPYCAFVKRDCLDRCIASQAQIRSRESAQGAFWHTCHAGVVERIYPFGKGREMIGYVAISGYRGETPPEDCRAVELWRENLHCAMPAQAYLDTAIPPLCRMLELLFSYPFEPENRGEYHLLMQFLYEQHGQVSLDDICKHLSRSKSHISHLFNEKNELSLRAYCMELKLSYAKTLLEDTYRSITEIASDAGFNDVSYFISKFREKFGITPLQYRKNLAAQDDKL